MALAFYATSYHENGLDGSSISCQLPYNTHRIADM